MTFNKNNSDYISLTDIARYKDPRRSDYILQNWLRTKSTIEFLGLWEQLNNPHFKSIEFDGFKKESGANSFSTAVLFAFHNNLANAKACHLLQYSPWQ